MRLPRICIPFLLLTLLPAQELATKKGFFTLEYDAKEAKIHLRIPEFDKDFLYVNSLPSGVGSNDIGLDRGKLGSTKVVRFHRVGKRVMLIQRNLQHRATTQNAEEKRAVDEAFASSVIWAFDVLEQDNGPVLVDATSFCVRDAFGVARTLKRTNQGAFKMDAKRSFVRWEKCGAFPKNTEMQATLTFEGTSPGRYLRDVTPTASVVSVQQRHSFIELPDDGYVPRRYDPRTGYSPVTWRDYATPISKPLVQQFIRRHRLVKKDPSAAMSEAVEPIVYYLDPGAPEPVRSALLDGARWWAKAFAAAGFKDAFRVELLPDGADPMDVRYNVIQWVHRSSRGWSYGNSITDPRTGEILKGHVTLGSRRVRQDYLIAQALIGADPKRCEAMALARLRQLSAHEVGHTLGLVHNFAASSDDRASVMDYPHPLLRLRDGKIDLSQAYGVGVGAWDVFSIRWGYSQLAKNERAQLDAMVAEARKSGLRFLSDRDARPAGGMHPIAHLWDNGTDPISELTSLLAIRKHAMRAFGPTILNDGEPATRLDELLTPLYLLHRYQVEAVSKLVGGAHYSIEGGKPAEPVLALDQASALDALIGTLAPEVLEIPAHIVRAIPPRTHGARRTRELLPSRSGVAFDALAAAEAAAEHTLRLLLHPQRATRLVGQHAADRKQLSLELVLQKLTEATVLDGDDTVLHRVVNGAVVEAIIRLAADRSAPAHVRNVARDTLLRLRNAAPQGWAIAQVKHYVEHSERYAHRSPAELPPGSPIGCACGH